MTAEPTLPDLAEDYDGGIIRIRGEGIPPEFNNPLRLPPPVPRNTIVPAQLQAFDEGGGIQHAVFQAFVKEAYFPPRGGMTITLGIPEDQKYLAIPTTDLRGMQIRIEVWRPPLYDEIIDNLDADGEDGD